MGERAQRQIAATLLDHLSLETTRGYTAVFSGGGIGATGQPPTLPTPRRSVGRTGRHDSWLRRLPRHAQALPRHQTHAEDCIRPPHRNPAGGCVRLRPGASQPPWRWGDDTQNRTSRPSDQEGVSRPLCGLVLALCQTGRTASSSTKIRTTVTTTQPLPSTHARGVPRGLGGPRSAVRRDRGQSPDPRRGATP